MAKSWFEIEKKLAKLEADLKVWSDGVTQWGSDVDKLHDRLTKEGLIPVKK